MVVSRSLFILLLPLLLVQLWAGYSIPTDDLSLNKFALIYNKYIESLKSNLIDVSLWRRVEREWSRLTGWTPPSR